MLGIGPYCPDCGTALKSIKDEWKEETASFYKCPKCKSKFVHKDGGVISSQFGSTLRKIS